MSTHSEYIREGGLGGDSGLARDIKSLARMLGWMVPVNRLNTKILGVRVCSSPGAQGRQKLPGHSMPAWSQGLDKSLT